MSFSKQQLRRTGLIDKIADALTGEPSEIRQETVPEKCATPGCQSTGNVKHGECDDCYMARQL